MASSDEDKSESEKHIVGQPDLEPGPPSASTPAEPVQQKKGRSKKFGAVDITSEDAFKPGPSKNKSTMASLFEAKEKLKAEVRKASKAEKAASRKQARLKAKAQNLSNDDLIEIIQQRRMNQEVAEKRAKAAQEATEEQLATQRAKRAKLAAK